MEMHYNKYGQCLETGLYKSRYYAKKAALGHEVVVKVEGGYKIMDAINYIQWKNDCKHG